jgi:hypothetical protein
VTGIAGRKLNSIRPGLCEERDYTRHIFDTWQETDLVEEAMINSKIEAVTVLSEKAIKAVDDGHQILLLDGRVEHQSRDNQHDCRSSASAPSKPGAQDAPKLSKPTPGLRFLEFNIWLFCSRFRRLGFIRKLGVLNIG